MFPELLRHTDMGVGILAEKLPVGAVDNRLPALLCDSVLRSRQTHRRQECRRCGRYPRLRRSAYCHLRLPRLDLRRSYHDNIRRSFGCLNRRRRYRLRPYNRGFYKLSEKVKKPVAVRYAFKDWVVGDLFCEDLPVSSFRSDEWK